MTLFDCLVRNPRAVKYVVSLMALYLHFGPFARYVSSHLGRKMREVDQGEVAEVRPALPVLPVVAA